MQTRCTSTKLIKEGQVLSLKLMWLKGKCAYDRIIMSVTKQICVTGIPVDKKGTSDLYDKSYEKAVIIDF